MKTIKYILSLSLFIMAGQISLAQSDNFQNLNTAAVYFDTYFNSFTKLNSDSDTRSLNPGDEIYFLLCGNTLHYAGQMGNLGGNCGNGNLGSNNYTVTQPNSNTPSGNLLSLFMTEATAGSPQTNYILLQFSTILVSDLNNANSLKVQSNHVQIAEGTIFRLEYEQNPEGCSDIFKKITVTW